MGKLFRKQHTSESQLGDDVIRDLAPEKRIP